MAKTIEQTYREGEAIPLNPDGKAAASKAMPLLQLDVFEGPLDLLLYLIRKNEIEITDIPIAKITAEYLSLLRLMEVFDLEVAGEYIVMAATLMRIKSAMLLPRDEELEDEEDPREELVQALIEYRKFKEGAEVLSNRETDERRIFARTDFAKGSLPTKSEFVMDYSFYDLLCAFREAMARIPAAETSHQVDIPQETVEDRIVELETLLEQQDTYEFMQLLTAAASRIMMIVTFLAILELVRLRRITVKQDRAFGSIVLVKRGN